MIGMSGQNTSRALVVPEQHTEGNASYNQIPVIAGQQRIAWSYLNRSHGIFPQQPQPQLQQCQPQPQQPTAVTLVPTTTNEASDPFTAEPPKFAVSDQELQQVNIPPELWGGLALILS